MTPHLVALAVFGGATLGAPPAPADWVNEQGQTPLSAWLCGSDAPAFLSTDDEKLREWLEAGVNPNAVDVTLRTAADCVEDGEVRALLVARGAEMGAAGLPPVMFWRHPSDDRREPVERWAAAEGDGGAPRQPSAAVGVRLGTSDVKSLALTSLGGGLVLAVADDALWLSSVVDGTILRTLTPGGLGPLVDGRFVNGGRLIFGRTRSAGLLWDTITGELLYRLRLGSAPGDEREVGDLIASLLDVATATPAALLAGYRPDDERAVWERESALFVLDLRSRRSRVIPTTVREEAGALSADGKWAAVVGNKRVGRRVKRVVELWREDADGWSLSGASPLDGGPGQLVVSASGVVIGVTLDEIWARRRVDGKLRLTWQQPAEGVFERVPRLSPDGLYVVETSGRGGRVHTVRSVGTGERLAAFGDDVRGISWGPDGQWVLTRRRVIGYENVVTAEDGARIRLWVEEGGVPVAFIDDQPHPILDAATGLPVAEGGQPTALLIGGHTVRLSAAQTNSDAGEVVEQGVEFYAAGAAPTLMTSSVVRQRLDADGPLGASSVAGPVAADRRWRALAMEDGSVVVEPRGEGGAASAARIEPARGRAVPVVATSDDGRRLFVATLDETLVWDVETGGLAHRLAPIGLDTAQFKAGTRDTLLATRTRFDVRPAKATLGTVSLSKGCVRWEGLVDGAAVDRAGRGTIAVTGDKARVRSAANADLGAFRAAARLPDGQPVGGGFEPLPTAVTVTPTGDWVGHAGDALAIHRGGQTSTYRALGSLVGGAWGPAPELTYDMTYGKTTSWRADAEVVGLQRLGTVYLRDERRGGPLVRIAQEGMGVGRDVLAVSNDTGVHIVDLASRRVTCSIDRPPGAGGIHRFVVSEVAERAFALSRGRVDVLHTRRCAWTGALVFRAGAEGLVWTWMTPDGRFATSSLDAPAHLGATHGLLSVAGDAFIRDFFRPGVVREIVGAAPAAPAQTAATYRPVALSRPSVAVAPGAALAKVRLALPAERDRLASVHVLRNGRVVARLGAAALTEDVATLTVPLPRRSSAWPVQIGAHTFNTDAQKGRTVWVQLDRPPPGPVRRTAFIVTVGISQQQSPEWVLNAAVRNASVLSESLGETFSRQGFDVAQIALWTASGQGVLPPNKANVKRVLETLAGKRAPSGRLRRANPDDVVVFYFAGHGLLHEDDLVLLPFDAGTGWQSDARPYERAISSAELASWWRGIEADHGAMIVDACYSAAAFGPAYRPAPLGGKGLGQLSYDAMLPVLVATQRVSQVQSLTHLTSQLVRNGLDLPSRFRGEGLDLEGWLQLPVDAAEASSPEDRPRLVRGSRRLRASDRVWLVDPDGSEAPSLMMGACP